MASNPHEPMGRRNDHSAPSSRASTVAYRPGGLSDDFINVDSLAAEKARPQEPSFNDKNEPTQFNYVPAPFKAPRAIIENKPPFLQRHSGLVGYVFLFLAVAGSGAGIFYVLITHRDTELWTEEESPEQTQRQLVLHFALWAVCSWSSFIVSYALAKAIPYIFYFVTRLVHPGHKKYWRIFKFLTKAVTLLGWSIGTYVPYTFLILNNKNLMVNAKKPTDTNSQIEALILRYLTRLTIRPAKRPWPRVVNDISTIFMMWSVAFFFEKLLILFVSIHYHYRAGGVRIRRNKRVRKALVALYEASIALNPAFEEPFKAEDAIIHGQLRDRLKYFHAHRSKQHVDRALQDPSSSAALAKRIWTSLVPEGQDRLTLADISEVIKSHRKAEAEEYFDAIDENDNGDITLNEMVLLVVEAGNSRRDLYQGMTDINQAINTLDWIGSVVITVVCTAFFILRYVRMMKGMKDALGITLIGLSFGFGRTLYEFLNGCIFIFLKHAYDVGDRIEVYNIAATVRTSVVVTRVSILYTLFRRLDNGKELQMSNDRLNMKRIENITRSGANREEIPVFVDFNTTFTDIERLKQELQLFVCRKSNSRDYQPGVEVRLTSIFEMNKLELICAFYHKSNWANEELRAARSSKFMCALLAALRKLPMHKPGSLPPRPNTHVPVTGLEVEEEEEQQAYEDFTALPISSEMASRDPFERNVASGVEINSWVQQGAMGLRRRHDQFNRFAGV